MSKSSAFMASAMINSIALKRRKSFSFTIICFLFVIALDLLVHSRLGIANLPFESSQQKQKSVAHPHRHEEPPQNLNLNPERRSYRISDSIKNEYKLWHSTVRKLSQLDRFPTEWKPDVNWKYHEMSRSKRFPGVEERIRYYMGIWYNVSIPMFGVQFDRDTYIQRQSTLQYEAFADILINLYDLDRDRLMECYQNKKELQVFSPYCRDYVDIAILHSGGLANVIHFIGDALPSYVPNELIKYPMFAKVRPLCNNGDNTGYVNSFCKNNLSMSPIILPLNRKRHLGVASEVPVNDIPWEQKKPMAIWRGKYEKVDRASIENGSISGSPDMKYALVSKYINSSVVDAKFSKDNDDAPVDMIGPYMDMKQQLKYRYIISVEGNDVSSGLKWMLLSSSIVLAPPFTWESWAMEGTLEPFVHYLPLNEDMSNVEEMISWAEKHPKQARIIAERSTLFMYDLLFHPDAAEDERLIIQGIVERYENNFGQGIMKHNGGDLSLPSHNQPSRSKRFPSVNERVEYYMGKWNSGHATISMKRDNIDHLNTLLPTGVTKAGPFIASGSDLAECGNDFHPSYTQNLCREALPYFDERNTADLKSNSFKRLLKTKKGSTMKLAHHSSWRNDNKGHKESKRVLLDDSVKVINFGLHRSNELDIPVFSSSREMDDEFGSILWPFGFRDNALLASDSVKRNDCDFTMKRARAREVEELLQNKAASSDVMIQEVLKYRYLIAKADIACGINDLVWMLLSSSVVLMPQIDCESWLMETKLQPFVHYLPINNDKSNVEQVVKWAEEHLDMTLLISKQSTVFIHDLLFDKDSIRDERMIMERIVTIYRQHYG